VLSTVFDRPSFVYNTDGSRRLNGTELKRQFVTLNMFRTMKHILRLVNYYKKRLLPQRNQTFLPWRFGLYQRCPSEEACSVLPPVLDTTEMRRGKKSVVRVA